MLIKEEIKTIESFQKFVEVYSYLEDDLSRSIFTQRILYNIDKAYLNDFVNFYTKPKEFQEKNVFDIINKIPDDTSFCIWGIGKFGKYILNSINTKKNIILSDKNYKQIKSFHEIPIISPAEMLKQCKDMKIIISSDSNRAEMSDFLIANNISKKNIIFSYLNNIEDQYFDEIITFSDNEIFVDVGAFDGHTSITFAKHCKKYKKIYVFEPDENNIQKINKSLQSQASPLKNIEIYPFGLWHEDCILNFEMASLCSSVVATGNTQIQARSLDNLLADEPITFIKMDIEGAELNALRGAKEIIGKYKPKLAISVYHKPEDIIVILEYIKSIVPEYKFYLRHYSALDVDTVLYAVI